MNWPAPVRLTPRVTLVGSGTLGFGLTDAHDSHVYLLDGGTDAVLIDAGCGLASDRIAANVRAVLGARPVSRILLTHAHADHAGGAADLARLLGATVHALGPAAAIVAAADEDASGLRNARRAGVYPPHLHPPAVPVHPLDGPGPVVGAVTLETHPAPGRDGPGPAVGAVTLETHPAPGHDVPGLAVGAVTLETHPASGRDGPGPGLAVGAVTLEVHPTPGHAAGHCCFSFRDAGIRVLFSGDLVFARGRVAVLATPDTDLVELALSLRAVHDLAPDVLLPGHGSPVLRDARAHLRTTVEHLDRGALPPGLLP